ncbi:hypothetical protein [Halobacteriovorax sp. HLS]|uniref:hypothetical protein n=1 Tax=Halobacteriovorax sp. HLS TaxID=2234000 RepID=UPI000FD6C7CF|nr:hypothetical protein [Halobacteriovorax sp. HLS]
MKFFAILLSLLLFSCTHTIKVNTKGCNTTGLYSETSANYLVLKKTITTYGLSQDLSLEKLLESRKLSCRKIKYINYTWKQGPIDSLVSILPFVNQKTLVLNYVYE